MSDETTYCCRVAGKVRAALRELREVLTDPERPRGGGYRGTLDGSQMEPPADIPTGALRDSEVDPMTDDATTRAALDEAIRAHAADAIDPDGEVITSWFVAAATRRFDGGGVVLTLVHDEAMPVWEARGLLTTALRSVDHQEDGDRPGGDP